MSTTITEAQADIFSIVQAVANANGVATRYEAMPGSVPTSETIWIRPTLRHATGGQVSLTGATGSIKWSREGTLWVQIFAPMGGGLSAAYEFAQKVLTAYQGVHTEHCVWFRNHRINEVGPDGEFYQINVLIDFIYEQIQ